MKKIGKDKIYLEPQGYVELWDSSQINASEKNRIEAIAQIASLAYGNDFAKNPQALYKRLQELKHESLWEFIRIGGQFSYKIKDSMRNDPDFYQHPFVAQTHSKYIAMFKIKVPIFVARQFMRHRSFSYLEMSRRYTKTSKKPIEIFRSSDMSEELYEDICTKSNELFERAKKETRTEIANRVFPQLSYTEFWCMTERDGLHNFFELRLKKDAQAEIKECAEAMHMLLLKHQPEAL